MWSSLLFRGGEGGSKEKDASSDILVQDGWDNDEETRDLADGNQMDPPDESDVDPPQEEEVFAPSDSLRQEQSSPGMSLMVGRLTRFLEQVTTNASMNSRKEEEEEEEDGWEEEEELLIDDDDDDDNNNNNNQQQGWISGEMMQGYYWKEQNDTEDLDNRDNFVNNEIQRGSANANTLNISYSTNVVDDNEQVTDDHQPNGWDEDYNLDPTHYIEEEPDPVSEEPSHVNQTTYDSIEEKPPVLENAPTSLNTVLSDDGSGAILFSAINDFGSALSQPLNNLLSEIRQMEDNVPRFPNPDDEDHEFQDIEDTKVQQLDTTFSSDTAEWQTPRPNFHQHDIVPDDNPEQMIPSMAGQQQENSDNRMGDPDTKHVLTPLPNHHISSLVNSTSNNTTNNLVEDNNDDDNNDDGQNRSMDRSVDLSDVVNHELAIRAIQKEMQAVMELQEKSKSRSFNIVDHTPDDRSNYENFASTADPSLQPLLESEDLTRDEGPSRPRDGDRPKYHQAGSNNLDDEDVYDDENEDNFGLVVDHTPSATPKQASLSTTTESTALSLVVQATELIQDFTADDAMDETVPDDGLEQDLDTLDNGQDDNNNHVDNNEQYSVGVQTALVDHTPSGKPTCLQNGYEETQGADDEDGRDTYDPSLVVLPSSEEVTMVLSESGGAGDQNRRGSADNDDLACEADDPCDYGPVVDHLPIEDDETIAATGTTAATTQSMAVNFATLEEDFRQDDAMDETVVDDEFFEDDKNQDVSVEQRLSHLIIPSNISENTSGEAAVVQDGWEEGDDVENENDTSVAEAERHVTLPPLEPYSMQNPSEDHVVDHTPSELGDDTFPRTRRHRFNPSVAVLAAAEDLSRDTGGIASGDEDVYDDENEMAYCPVVDLTPHLQQEQLLLPPPSAANSVAAHCAVGDYDNTSVFFGDSTIGDGLTTLDDLMAGDQGTIEDTLAEIDADQSLELLAKEGEDERQGEPENTKEETMVDHLPFEMREPFLRATSTDPSLAVLASIDENDSATADEQNAVYGPMVDHTPTTPADPPLPRSDSVVAQLNEDEQEDATLGNTLDDGDTIDDEMPSALRSFHHPNDGDAFVVDRVPPRPESRFGDASTVVAADASEVMSGVDDMEELGGFGPVVDQTPPSAAFIPGAVPSGAGSTVVFAPQSVGGDDFDPDETAHGDDDIDDEDGWVNDQDPISEEAVAAPNPQSDDEPIRPPVVVEEQVVDFLPGPETEANNDADAEPSSEDSSEYAVGGAQSLLQPEDPKEDDFGPVVDVTPIPRSGASMSSTVATLVTASEIGRLEKDDATSQVEVEAHEGNAVVDHVPHMRDLRAADSLATVGQSQFTEEDDDVEEEETDSKFGPVVDQLPTPRGTATASRSGSTVDALGTVSEGGSAGETDAWAEDDLDLDGASDAASTSPAVPPYKGLFRRSSTAEHSVRFDSSVRGASTDDSSSINKSNNETVYFDTNMAPAADETQYFEVEGPTGSQRPGASFAEAETPPSTPHHRTGIKIRRPLLEAAVASITPWLDLSASGADDETKTGAVCNLCQTSSDGECPCVQKLLDVTKQKGTLYGTLIAADGSLLQVNFGQMLQDEMVKRRLLEEEAKALRELCGKQEEELASMAADLQEERAVLRQESSSMPKADDRQQNATASRPSEIAELEEKLKQIEQMARNEKADWALQMEKLEKELEVARQELEVHQGEAAVQLEQQLAEANKESASVYTQMVEKEHAYQVLEAQLSELNKQLSAERQSTEVEKSTLYMELEEKEVERQQLEARVSEISHLLLITHESAKEKASELELQLSRKEEDRRLFEIQASELSRTLSMVQKNAEEKTALLQSQLEEKEATCRQLEDLMADLNRNVSAAQQQAGLEGSVIISELQSKVAEADRAQGLLQLQLSEARQDLVSGKAEIEREREEYSRSLEILKKEVNTKEADCDRLQAQLMAASEQLQSFQERFTQEKAQGDQSFDAAEGRRRELEHDLLILREKLHVAEQLNNENDVTITSLELEKTELEAQLEEKEIELTNSIETLRGEIDAAHSTNQKLSKDLVTLKADRADLRRRLVDMEEVHQQYAERQIELEKKLEQSIISIEQKEAEKVSLEVDWSSKYSIMEQDLTMVSNDLSAMAKERDSLSKRLAETEEMVSVLQQRVDEQGAEQQILESKRNDDILSLNKLSASLLEKEEQIASLSGSLSHVSSTLTEKEERISSLSASLAQLQRENVTLSQQLASWTSKASFLEKTAEAESASLRAEQRKSSDVLKEMQSLRDATASLNLKLSNTESELENLRGEYESVKMLCAHREEIVNTLESQLSSEREKLQVLETECSNWRKSLDKLAAEKASLEASLSQALAESNTRFEHDVQEREAHLARLKEERELWHHREETAAELERELNFARHRIHMLESESANWTESFERLAADKSSTVESLTRALSEANARFEQHARESEDHTARLHDECENLRRQLHTEGRNRAALDDVRQEMLSKVSSERDALAEENEELLVHLGLLKEQMDAFEENRESGNDWKEYLDRIRQEHQEELEASERERVAAVSSLETRSQRLEQECLAKQVELDRLLQADQAAKTLKSDMAEMQSKLEQLDSLCLRQKETLTRKDYEIASVKARLSQALRDDQAVADLNQRIQELEAEKLDDQLRTSESEKEWEALLDQKRLEYEHRLMAGERDRVSEVSLLESRCEQLEQECSAKQSELDRLLQIESISEALKGNMQKMQTRLDQLETESIRHKETLAAKEMHITSVEERLSQVLHDDQVVMALNQRVRELEGERVAAQMRAAEVDQNWKALLDQTRLKYEENLNASERERVLAASTLESRCEDLEKECSSKQVELDRLLQIEQVSAMLKSNLEKMQTRLNQLEFESNQHRQTLEAKDALLLSKEAENEELFIQLGLLKDHMDAFEENQISENDWKEYVDRLRQEHQETLEAKDREKVLAVSSLETRCQRLEQECAAKKAEIDRLLQIEQESKAFKSSMAEMQSRLNQLESESSTLKESLASKEVLLGSTETRISQVLQDNEMVATLGQRVYELESENRVAQMRVLESESSLKQFQDQMKREHEQAIDNMNRQLLELEDKSRAAQTRALEKENEFRLFQDLIKKERDQDRIGNELTVENLKVLQSELESTKTALRAAQAMLLSKEEEIEKLLSDNRTNNNNNSDFPGFSWNDDVLGLRSQLVSLAKALERSEMRRAEAMDNLQLERQVHADSLRKLGESVKRYFSTVSGSNGV